MFQSKTSTVKEGQQRGNPTALWVQMYVKTTIMIYTTCMIINKSQVFRLSHDVVTCDEDSEVRLNTACLLQVMRSTGHA